MITQDNWQEILNVKPGDILEGRVVRIEHYGVFIDLNKGVNGLILVPHLSNKPLDIEDYPKINTQVQCKVLAFSENIQNPQFHYISLCMR